MNYLLKLSQVIKLLVNVNSNKGFAFMVTFFYELVLFDIIRGTNTHLRNMRLIDEKSVHYVAVFTSTLKKIKKELKKIKSTIDEEFVFFDLGSGKAKPIIYLSKYFKSSYFVGVEYDDELIGISKQNLKKTQSNNCSIIKEDIRNVKNYVSKKTDFTLIFYLFNPCKKEPFILIIQKLLKLNINKIFLIYVDPIYHEELCNRNFILKYNYVGKYNSSTFNIYTHCL